MFILRLTILLLTCVISSNKSKIDLHIVDCEILFAKNMVECKEISFAVSHYFKDHQYPHQTQASSIVQLLLVLSGSVEINPGPRVPKFPCRECHKAVSIGPSIACDNCDQWFHKSCINMNAIIFEAYQQTAQWNGYAVVVFFPMLQANW